MPILFQVEIPWEFNAALWHLLEAFASPVHHGLRRGGANFLASIHELIRVNDPSVIALVETHFSGGRADLVCRSIGFDGVLRVDAKGFVNGIWLLWRSDLVVVTPITLNPQNVTVEIACRGDILRVLSMVYASPNYNRRDRLWAELGEFARNNNKSWLIGSDFNSTIDSSERTYDLEYANRASEAFASWVDDSLLIDLGFLGPRFMWKYGTTIHTYRPSHLDRFLCSDSWRLACLEASVQHLSTSDSDHSPLLLKAHPSISLHSGERPFHFLVAWTLRGDYNDVVASSWHSNEDPLSVTGHNWLSRFKNIFFRKRKLVAQIEGARRKLCHSPSQHLLNLERQLCMEIDDVLAQEQLLGFQKSRVNFLIDDNHNTRYYHLSTVVRRRSNKISCLMNQAGDWVSNRGELEKLVVDFFASLYTTEVSPSDLVEIPTLSISFLRLEEVAVNGLISPFTTSEVWAAL
ncbi:hypothetical protein V2J09_001380 [Rumex salicifolius]